MQMGKAQAPPHKIRGVSRIKGGRVFLSVKINKGFLRKE